MMQFSESAPPQMHPNTLGLCLDLPPPAPGPTTTVPPSSKAGASTGINHPASWPTKSAAAAFTATAATFSSASSCIEQLLVHCAHAVESGDATLAHQILWVLNNIAPPDGDSTQRLASAFLRSLVSRASFLQLPSCTSPSAIDLHRFSPLDLASFLDLTPFHRFGFAASNSAIHDAADGLPFLHIVDLSTTHCMQIPTLIDSLASRPDGPPFLRLTVPSAPHTLLPPLLHSSLDDLGSRLIAFARSRNVGMEFKVVPSDPADGFQTLMHHLRMQHRSLDHEALVINCQMLLHYVPDETAATSARSMLAKNLRSLEPNLVTLVDEDVDLTDEDVVERLRAAFNYLWIPYDAVDTFLPKGSERRRWYEAEVCWKIENVIACEGLGRVERPEGRPRWAARMRGAGFHAVGFGEEAAGEVKGLLDEHAAGWGLKKEDEDSGLVLTWKGHNVVFASAWVPS